jgi:triosephosphate isomerase
VSTPARLPLIAGNWKMNTTVAEALTLVEAMRSSLEAIANVEAVLCPPFVSLQAVHDRLGSSSVRVGAQDVFWEEKGAYTGEISPRMLEPIVRYVIVGHSERRQYFNATDDVVNRQVRACFAHGLQPIVCVGERLDEYERGETEAVVERQTRGALRDVSSSPGLVFAYEPVWAIGTGRAATGAGANRVIRRIRQILGETLGRDAAESTRILYGGSVTAANIGDFIGEEEIDGALVGGASLRPDEFVAIARVSALAKTLPD